MSLQPEVRETLNTLLREMSDQELIEHINGYTLFKNKPRGCQIPAYKTFISDAKAEVQRRNIGFYFLSKASIGSIVKTWSGDMRITDVKRPNGTEKHEPVMIVTFERSDGSKFILSRNKKKSPRFWYT